MGIINGIKGFFIGIALVIPGLSGSIFAVVVGLYEDIIHSVSNFTKDVKGAIKFLSPIAVGACIGILASTKAILWVCERYEFESYLFFIGCVLGSVPLILKKTKKIKFKPPYLLISVLSFLAILFITRLGAGGEQSYVAIRSLKTMSDALEMAFAGVFSVSLMAIPGVSGSVMLMVIKQYGTVYNAVGSTLDMVGFLLRGDMPGAFEALQTVALIAPFLLGALVGFIFIAKLMSFLLKKCEALVYYAVAGLILGAVVTLLQAGVAPNIIAVKPVGLLIGAASLAAGLLCTVFLDKPDHKE